MTGTPWFHEPERQMEGAEEEMLRGMVWVLLIAAWLVVAALAWGQVDAWRHGVVVMARVTGVSDFYHQGQEPFSIVEIQWDDASTGKLREAHLRVPFDVMQTLPRDFVEVLYYPGSRKQTVLTVMQWHWPIPAFLTVCALLLAWWFIARQWAQRSARRDRRRRKPAGPRRYTLNEPAPH